MKISRFPVALLGGVSVLALASGAYAQTANPPANAAAPASNNEIVVTGSRVITNGNNSPTPLTVVSANQLQELQPTTINDALNNLPVFQGSRGQFSTPNTTGLFGGGNPATDELNLRNLSPQRTLVLFDGQRVAPSNALGVVDVDMIPQELIQRVDIVTGGGSAVYGSDAIAGVVNYVTDHNFNGFKADGNYGVSSFGDDQSWNLGFAAGTKFADGKGHIEASFNHYSDAGIPNRYDRGYYNCSLLGSVAGSTATPGSTANPYEDYCNVHSNQYTYGGLITNGALKGQTFDANGVLNAFTGTPTGTSTSDIGGDGAQAGGYASLKAPEDFNQVFVRLDYDLTEQIHFHTEASGNWKADTTYSAATNGPTTSLTFNTANPYLPAAYAAAMGSATTFTLGKVFNQIPLLTQTSNVQNIFVNGGFDGKVFGRFDWGVDVDYSNNLTHDNFTNNVNNENLAAALDAVTVTSANVGSSGLPIGSVACYAALVNPAAYSKCAPYNAFGPTAASQAAINYVTQNTYYNPLFTQIEVGAHISGDIFSLPAGPVTGALSGEYRKQSFSATSDASPTQLENCTGLRYNCTATSAIINASFAPSSTVSQSVKEGAVEFDAPLLKDFPFAQAIDLNGALRYTSYDFGGNNWTYKIGLVWHISDEYEIRATESQDIEAPTLGMLFQAPLQSLGNNQDLLLNTIYQAPQNNIGNANLTSEVGHTTTAGFVWKPHVIPGFSLSIDAYHIIIDNALSQVQGQAAQTQEVCLASGGTSPYCALQVRALGSYTSTNPANVVTAWYDEFINVSTVETYGADIELNYARRLFDRPFSVRLFTTWQPHLIYQTPGQATFDYAGVAFPNLVPLQDVPTVQLLGTVSYALTDNFDVQVSERWRSAMALEPAGAYAAVISNGVGAYATTDLNLSYRLGKTSNDEIYVNIRDLFNVLPQSITGASNNPGFPVTDDPDGRYISFGFRSRF